MASCADCVTVTGRSVERDLACVGGCDAEEGQADVGASCADETGKSQHLPRTQVERDVLKDALAAETADRQDGRRPVGAARAGRAPDFAADHAADGRAPASARARGVVEIQRPSRRTVTRSAISKTSSMRWEMKRMATPCWRRVWTMRKSRWTSCAEREAVGSSMIRTRTSSEIALAISTVCCSARVRPRAGSSTSSRTSSRARTLSRLAFHPAPVDELAAIAVADEDVLGDGEVREDHRLLIDGGDAEALGILGGRDDGPARRREDLAAVRAAGPRS